MVAHIAKISLLLVSLCLLQAFVCGEQRIYGGTPIWISQAPYALSVRINNWHLCGATLLSGRHALTSRNCVGNRYPEDLTVVGGATYTDEAGVRRYVQKLIKPYDVQVDLVMLKLVSAMYGSDIAIIGRCSQQWSVGDNVQTFGWGQRTEGGPNSYVLESAWMSLISKAKCVKRYLGTSVRLTDTSFCMVAPSADTCNGDEGGPVVHNGKVCGVVSGGWGCGRGYPSICTSILATKDFIDLALTL